MADSYGLADQRDLAVWAGTVEAKTEFPRLVRRLILETGVGLTALGMPAGEGVASEGWDGTVRAQEATHKIPLGDSVWEVSTHSNPNKKAQEDYEKRRAAPGGLQPANVTYVEVILRRWADRANWAAQRTADGRWREVRAYGLDDVELWLEDAPATRLWISEKLGLRPTGIKSAERWWDDWSTKTTPALSPDIPLAGRDEEEARLKAFLTGVGGGSLTIGAPSVDEAIAFAVAFVRSTTDDPEDTLSSRTIIVDGPVALRRLADHSRQLVLILADSSLASEIPATNKHRVVIPVGQLHGVDLRLGRLDASKVAAALRAVGMEERRAEQLGRLARRSLTAFRRRIAVQPALHRPIWADQPISRAIRAGLLAGGWQDDNVGDREVLASLSGADYEIFREAFGEGEASSDPFISKVGQLWEVVSLEDAWLLLQEQLTSDDVRRFEQAAVEVLGEVHPETELPVDERWMAAVRGKVPKYSAELKRGLARSLALMGTYGQDVQVTASGTAAAWAASIVRTILDAANAGTGARWQSIVEYLPLLAEAAPDAVLDAIDRGVAGEEPLLRKLFTDSEDSSSMTGRAYHSGLLWALETIAWATDHVGMVSELLARLVEIDPGGRYTNRPLESLHKIYCPWSPQTSASAAARLDALDGLRQRRPSVAWKLMLNMIPDSREVLFPSNQPQYRDWKPAELKVLRTELMSLLSEVTSRLIADAGNSAAHWENLVGKLDDLPPADRDQMLAALDSLAGSRGLDAPTDSLWRKLSELIGKHREFPTAAWALPSDVLDRMQQIAYKLEPQDKVSRSKMLFDEWHPFIGGDIERSDFDAHQKEVTRLRAEAMREVDQQGGLDAVLSLAANSKLPWAAGIALADATNSKYDGHVIQMLGVDGSPIANFAGAFMMRRFEAAGWQWLDTMLARDAEQLSATQMALMLAATRDHPRSWERAEELGEDVSRQYWHWFQYTGLGGDFQHVDFVFERLMKEGRPAAAIDFLHLYARKEWTAERAALVADALEAILASDLHADVREASAVRHMDLRGLFDVLEQQRSALGDDRVGRLEWAYLPALGFDASAPALEAGMARSPEFFAEVVAIVYRKRRIVDGNEDAQDEQEEEEFTDEERERRSQRAGNAYRLLTNWGTPPGVEDGAIDSMKLDEWFDAAMAALEAAGRLRPGLHHVGQVLIHAPSPEGESWPPVAIRDLLERVKNKDLEQGMFLGLVNRRGVTSRGLEEGGDQERDLAAEYRRSADQFANRWPRTAVILREVAKSLENDARRNEDEAERFRQGLA